MIAKSIGHDSVAMPRTVPPAKIETWAQAASLPELKDAVGSQTQCAIGA